MALRGALGLGVTKVGKEDGAVTPKRRTGQISRENPKTRRVSHTVGVSQGLREMAW